MYRWFGIAVANGGSFNAFVKHEIGTCTEAAIGFIEKTRWPVSVCFMQLPNQCQQSAEQFHFDDCQFSAEPTQQAVKHWFRYLNANEENEMITLKSLNKTHEIGND